MKRVAFALAVLLLVLAGVAVLGADAALRSATVRARVAAAARAAGYATNLGDGGADGAALSVSGVWTLRPTLEARNVVVRNPPGFAGADLARVARVSARVALLPLLWRRVEVDDIAVDGADLRLERDAAGRGNWERVPEPAGTAAPSSGPGRKGEARIGHVTVTESRVAWPGAPMLTIGRLEADASGGPVSGTVAVGGTALALSGTAGPDGFDVTGSDAGTGLTLAAAGAPGGAILVRGRVADLSALSVLAGRALPPLRDVAAEARVAGGAVVSFQGTAGLSPLGPDLVLERLEAASSAPGAPVGVQATGRFRGLAMAAVVTLPPLAGLRAGGPLAGKAVVTADGGTVTVEGSAAGLSGDDLQATVSARVPDLRRAGALAGVALPALHDLVADARLAPAPGGGVAVRGLRATAAEGDVGGDLVLRRDPVPSLRGSVVSQRLDLDAMLAPAPAPAPAATAVPTVAPAAPPPGAAPGAVPARAASPADAAPLPFAALRAMDLDVRGTAASVQWQRVAFRAVQLRVLLRDGVLRVDPAEALTPGGSVQAQLSADATAVPPTAGLALLAPGLDATAAAAALGHPGAAAGTVDLDVQLRGAGADLRAMLPTLDGHVGIALVNGEVDNGLLLAALGPALRAAKLPDEAPGQGGSRTAVRCLAVRADVAAGRVDLRTLVLDSSRLRLDGEGIVNLGDATVDLHLRPVVRLGGAGVAVPVHLSGPWRAPAAALERGAISPGRVGLSILLGGGAPAPDTCGPALAAARGGRPGPVP